MLRHLSCLLVCASLPIAGCTQDDEMMVNDIAEPGATSADVPERAEDVRPVSEGERAPTAALRSPSDETVELADVYAEGPTMLVFYRGGWCPYCNEQLGALSEAHDELVEMGYQVVGVSPDRPAKLAESMEELNVPYTLLSDADMRLARAFGLAFRVDDETIEKYREYDIDLADASGHDHHMLPVPAVALIDREGVIRYLDYDTDYRERLEPDELLEAARDMDDD